MATQQQPDSGRSYTIAGVARGLEPRPIDDTKADWITAGAKQGPALPSRRKPASGVHRYWRPSEAKDPDRRIGGSERGLRGPRPPLITEPVEVRNCVDAGGAIRQQRRALGHTADVAGTAIGVWPSNLLDVERGRPTQLATLIRIADGLGLRVLLAPKEAAHG